MRTFLLEFFYSAILWGSLITWLLWQLRRQSTSGIARKLLWLPLAWFGLHTALAWYGFILPPSGRLVDADSGQPIKNTRVIATWIGVLPPSLWTTVCSGRQAHLTDADGDFAFRYAPLPTLFSGMVARGQRTIATGYINQGRLVFILAPLWGELPLQHYAPGLSLSGGANTECKLDIRVQYDYGFSVNTSLLPGEQHPFEIGYREACIEQQPWTLTDAYLWDLSQYSASFGGVYVTRPPAPKEIAELTYKELGNKYCPGVLGVCVYPVKPNVRDQFCTYFKKLHDDRGLPQ